MFLKLLEIEDRKYLDFLAKLAFDLKIEDKVRDYYFEFEPKYDETGRTETFQKFFEKGLEMELGYYFIEKISEDEYEEEELVNKYIWLSDEEHSNLKFIKKLRNFDSKDLVKAIREDFKGN